jgi:nucleoside-diphosphate-sugar epimerase
MRVLVTGGTGLVGSHVIERLVRRGDAVQALVRRRAAVPLVESLGAEAVLGAVERPEGWQAPAVVDAIVHAAALVVQAAPWDHYRAVNVEGTRLAAEAAARHGARLVHVSSVAVYGRRPILSDGARVAEDTPFGPIAEIDFYARSKRQAEEVLWSTARERGVSAAALRPCVIYGERERIFMGRVLRFLRLGMAPLVGQGNNGLAVVYAGHVADAVVAALDRRHAEGPFNTANDGRITQREFFETIAEASGQRLRLVPLPLGAAIAASHAWHLAQRLLRPGRYAGLAGAGPRFMARENPYTSERAARELGWRPTASPHDTLRRTVEWFLREGRGG